MVVQSERLFGDPSVAPSVARWLGMPATPEPLPSLNHAQRVEEASAAVVARLRRHFEPHNQALADLLGPRWTAWDARSTAGRRRPTP